jgi:hypothetical protein
MPKKVKRKGRKPPATPKSGPITFDQHTEVRAIARERVGTVKAARVIEPKDKRKKPKHKGQVDSGEVRDDV